MSSKIFIGNIPYGVTDEAIVDILSRAGTVLNFRAMTDKETGKPKGYGFAEFSDPDAALSAVRNLNNHELQGRQLRVDYANEKDRENHASGYQQQQQQQQQQHGSTTHTTHITNTQGAASRLPPLPPGVELPPGVKAEDAISKTLQTLPPSQLLDILVQMQNLVLHDPVQAQQVLDSSPQLSFAIFQALLQLKLVDPTTVASVMQHASAPPAQQPQAAYQPPPSAPPPQQPHYAAPPQQYQQYPGQPYTPPQPVAAAAPPPIDPARAALIQQLLAMTPDQINALQPQERQEIMALRAQFQSQYR
ncbi:hypothetical protein BT63DRAFT_434676 [Microthyrium microscopicum]|uniref:RRM domain-containing protein n=1 Tax=Microthyrium microscopicum TaxID=703497 RepID=A0A6A6TZ46_9PEZI|nr:hypothetical protein BT63DRAFT_434676 [Microthyrium microscopicum]